MPAARTVTPSPPASIHTIEVQDDNNVEDHPSDANERTSLLRTTSRNSAAPKVYVNSKHGRVAKPTSAARRPATVEQEAVKVQQGQRRILTSIPMQILFFSVLATTFASLAMVLVLSLNAAYDFSSALLPYRGSGMLEVWIAGLGAWTGFQTIFFFASPVYLIFLVNLLSLLLLTVLFLMTMISPPLRTAHYPLMFVPLGITALTYLLALLSSYAVRKARDTEGKRLMQVLAERHAEEGMNGRGRVNASERRAAQREHEEEIAQALVGMQGNGFWKGLARGLKAVLGFIGSLAGVTVVTLLIANLCLRAYDNTVPLLSEESKLIRVHPAGYPWSFNVHLLCTDAPPHLNESDPTFAMADLSEDLQVPFTFPSDHKAPRNNHTHYPTIIYEAPSGVPGSLAHVRPARVKNPYNPFPQPTPPNNGTDINQVSPYPGSWILSLQKARKVARVCVWDRPGYGFSDSGPVELGMVADSLQQALEKAGEKGPYILVGDGYGGMVTRVFASRHKKQVHSILHIDAQTAQTYFRFPPGWNLLTLRLHRLWDHLLPSLASPLGLHRFYSLFTQYDPSLSRILASKRPPPSTAKLSEKMLRTLLAETYQAHTHDSQSYTDLLKAQPPKYPSDTPAIILSSREQMEKEKSWAEGQRSLAEEITSETGRVDWQVIKGNVGHDLCSPTAGKDARGRRACSRALVHLFSLE